MSDTAHSRRSVRLCHLYPDIMNIYADRGNIAVLRQRLAWRDMDLEVTETSLGDSVDPAAFDMYYMSGGQDRDQFIVAEDLVATKGDAIRSAADDGAAQLYVCGGIQLAGHRYLAQNGDTMTGISLLDLETTAGDVRLIGDLVMDVTLEGTTKRVVGYENHAGQTHLGTDAKPLGNVVVGNGNNGSDGFEGCTRDRVIGTYVHGPLLPKNPWLADTLLGWALAHRYDDAVALDPLDDSLEDQARNAAEKRAQLVDR